MITTSLNVLTGVYNAINSIIGDANPSGSLIRVRHAMEKRDKKTPICVYQIITDVVNQGLSKSIYEEIDVQVDFYGHVNVITYEDLVEISDALFKVFNRLTIEVEGVGGAIVSGTVQNISTEEDDGDIIRIRSEYNLKIV